MRFAGVISLVLVLTLALAACGDDPGETPTGVYSETVHFTRAGHDVTLNVEIADSAEERATGLMNRESVPEDAGMLFLWPEDTESGFWMKDTTVPLTVAFISATGSVVHFEALEPLDQELRHAPEQFRYAVEANRGWFEDNDVEVGDLLQLPVGVGS
ncbi:MAG: DUF192 domain-containing protein [Dehalococcoidia bacterium]